MVRLLFWRSGKLGFTPSLPLFRRPFWLGVVVPVWVPSESKRSVWKFFILKRNTLNHITVCKLFVFGWNTWNHITVCKNCYNHWVGIVTWNHIITYHFKNHPNKSKKHTGHCWQNVSRKRNSTRILQAVLNKFWK